MKDTLFAIGEALIDFIPYKYGCDFSEVTAFAPKIGGAPTNVLGAFAKLGGKTRLCTQLGNDPFGDKISDALKQYNIGTEFVTRTDAANTALAFVSLSADGARTFSFYRNPSADMLYTAENLKKSDFKNCFALHFCSVSLGDFPMKDAHRRAIEFAKQNGAIISFDPNLRFPLWKSREDLKAAIIEFLAYADIIKISDEELSFITETDNVQKGCQRLLKTAKLVLHTCGADGAYAFTSNAQAFSPSEKIKAIDTTGAGDAFCGSFLYNLYQNGIDRDGLERLSETELKNYLAASNKYCGESVQRFGAIESYPNTL